MASLVTHSLMGSSSNDADHNLVVPVSLFVAVLCVCIVLGHLLRERGWANESITALIIGCITGTVILMRSRGSNPHILRFDEDLFFIYLLPPIIFNAGFQIKKKRFFQNIVAIVLFGVVGVFISSTVISAGSWWLFPKLGLLGLRVRDYLALGAIFSSTDTVCSLQVLPEDVTPILHSMIFGEGVVNDATAVVLFRSVQKIAVSHVDGISAVRIANDFLYLFSASTILGIFTGLLTAYAMKVLYFGRHSTDREISLMVLMAYLSYVLSEFLDLSGILTIFFCGIIMSHYAWHNVSESSGITTRHAFATMSFVAQTFIFLYVGMDALDIEKWKMTKSRDSLIRGQFEAKVFGEKAICIYILRAHVFLLDIHRDLFHNNIIDFTWTSCFCVSSLSIVKLSDWRSRKPSAHIQMPACAVVMWSNERSCVNSFDFQSVHSFWCYAEPTSCNNDNQHHNCCTLHYCGV
ncbi:sodium/hydrogen exchanger 4 isoform X8 [Amborella trichopoda]|uniref:sodium/hydrogen exchanger 4 isoform X8 n=1 Tax=Amborella trichopoda TaxID=13333 RepID=UPI0009BEC5EB|nr:sodium/hydrogen exchanger 4 isoform X8 [Amborella trichopoda]|eukprot:XP_020523433.1 sodium/hydrogen exchanger 4 isoform X8 [Amborella trichopoda]